MLILQLEPLFTLIPELSYGASDEESYRFYHVLIPELLSSISESFDECSAPDDLRAVAGTAAKTYSDALEL